MLKDTIFSTTTRAVSLMEYAKVSPIPISTKRVRTNKTRKPLFMDVVVEMIQLVTTSWDEDIMQEWEVDTPTPTPTSMGMVPAVGIIKIKDSRDLYFLLSHLDTVVVVVGEVIMEKDDTIIIIMVLHSLLDHQGIEAPHLHLLGHLGITVLHHLQDHLDIMVPHHHHPRCLMDPVDIIGIMDHSHHHLPDLDIIGLHPHHLDVVISHLRLHHLDAIMNVDHRHLDMDHLLLLDVVIFHLHLHLPDVVMGVDL
jgi:hypothetical protein